MRSVLGLIIFLIYISNVFSQTSHETTNGRIIYKRILNGKTDYIEMLFNQQEFRYRLSKTPDFASYTEFEKFEHEIDKNDSLTDRQKLDLLQEKAPYASFYRKLSAPSRYMYSIASYKQKTCVCDTLNLHTNWELIDGTKEIEGIVCGMAKTSNQQGIQFLAYYAKTIPVSAAPFGLEGLPGLLIKLENLTTTDSGWELFDLAWPYNDALVVKLNLCHDYKIINRERERKEFESQNKKMNEFMERFKRGEKLNIKDMFN